MYDTVQTMAVSPAGSCETSPSMSADTVSDLLLELSDRAFVLDDERAGIALERAARDVRDWISTSDLDSRLDEARIEGRDEGWSNAWDEARDDISNLRDGRDDDYAKIAKQGDEIKALREQLADAAWDLEP